MNHRRTFKMFQWKTLDLALEFKDLDGYRKPHCIYIISIACPSVGNVFLSKKDLPLYTTHPDIDGSKSGHGSN